jgi:hypothetical protein
VVNVEAMARLNGSKEGRARMEVVLRHKLKELGRLVYYYKNRG